MADHRALADAQLAEHIRAATAPTRSTARRRRRQRRQQRIALSAGLLLIALAVRALAGLL